MMWEDDIDKVFRDGIPASSSLRKEEKEDLWQRIEKDLDKKPDRKRPVIYLLPLLGLLLLAGTAVFVLNTGKDNNEQPKLAKNIVVEHKEAAAEKTAPASNRIAAENTSLEQAPVNSSLAAAVKTAATLQLNSNGESLKEYIAEEKVNTSTRETVLATASGEEESLERMDFDPSLRSIRKVPLPGAHIQGGRYPSVKNKVPEKKHPVYVDITGGINVASLKKTAGFYAGVVLNKPLKKGAAVSAALMYSASNLSEKYMLSNKPADNKETDAILNRMSMLQLNFQLRQRVKDSKLSLSAGLMPVYVLSAAFHNVPVIDSSSPALYRRFELDDINRLNVLFSTSARYEFSQGLSAEITGCYGLTGLVKNSYINQSNLKGNFRSVQLGLVYRLK
ncbi:MAG: porin family protein [Ferruginibacter sp.]